MTVFRAFSKTSFNQYVLKRMLNSALLLAVFFMLSGFAMANSTQWPPPEPVQQRLDQALELVDDLQKMIPTYSDDLSEMAFQMEFDIEQAIQHVRNDIHYVPYSGVLRGIEGTIATRGGNSWDQSLLLAGLIKTIGGDAQIVSGTIPSSDVERLLGQLLSDVSRTASEATHFDPDSMLERVAQYDQSLSDRVAESRKTSLVRQELQALDQATRQMSDRLITLVEHHGFEISSEERPANLIEDIAKHYAWVQWRIGPGSEWQQVHPAFGAELEPAAEAVRYFDGEIPVEHQHRIAFDLYIERTTQGNSELVKVMDRFERPTAQLHKQPLALGMGPLPNQNVENGAILVPVLNNQLAPGAQAVTEQGMTADAGDAASAAGQLFATVSNRMGSALGALSEATGNDSSSAPRLTGVILKTELIEPDKKSQIIQRRIVDLRQAASDQDILFPQSATVGLSVEIDVGAKNSVLLTHDLLEQQRKLLEAMPVLMASARGALDFEQAAGTEPIKQLGPARWIDFDLFSGTALPKPTAEQAAFRTGAMVAMRRTFADRENLNDGGLLSVSDILTNPVNVLRRSASGALVHDARASIQQGVRETFLESELALHNGGWSQRNPSKLISQAAALDAHADSANWSALALDVATADLNSGYLLGIVEGAQPHWWRIHPETGQTLGMSQYGGSETVFYVTLVGGALISAYFFRDSVQSCDKTYSNNQEMADCCIVGNLGATYATSVVTGVSSALQAAPWAAANGRLIAGLEITTGLADEVATNAVVGEVTKKPIDSICRTYLNRQQ